MVRDGGFYYVIGYGENINIPTIDVISREISFIGNLVGTYADLAELMTLTAQGKVTPAHQHLSARCDQRRDGRPRRRPPPGPRHPDPAERPDGGLDRWERSSTSTTRPASCCRPGVDELANTVKVTLGPKGRNVVLERLTGAPTITNDGVSIAREIELSNPLKNMGAQLVREVANKTSDLTGDGTTTATLLAQAIVREGMKALEEGANPMLLRRGIEDATELVVAELRRGARRGHGRGRPRARGDDRRQGGRADRRARWPRRSHRVGPRAS